MRANVPAYDLRAANSLDEALALRTAGYQPIAGGTDLMVLFQANKLTDRRFVDISHIPNLKTISTTPETIIVGALATYTEIQRHPLLQSEFAMLCQAASWTGSIANQNRGTIGGNIANASPAADSLPALLVYEARLILASERGVRTVDYNRFHTGYKQSLMAPDELIQAIELSRPSAPRKEYSRKVGTRRAQAISKICFAGMKQGNEIRIALGSVAPTPIRCPKTEQAIQNGEPAIEMLLSEIAPIDDIRSTAHYRNRVAANLLEEFLRAIA
jgi:CO/xanthine dehydrogenase FAD-binding subunit